MWWNIRSREDNVAEKCGGIVVSEQTNTRETESFYLLTIA